MPPNRHLEGMQAAAVEALRHTSGGMMWNRFNRRQASLRGLSAGQPGGVGELPPRVRASQAFPRQAPSPKKLVGWIIAK